MLDDPFNFGFWAICTVKDLGRQAGFIKNYGKLRYELKVPGSGVHFRFRKSVTEVQACTEQEAQEFLENKNQEAKLSE